MNMFIRLLANRVLTTLEQKSRNISFGFFTGIAGDGFEPPTFGL